MNTKHIDSIFFIALILLTHICSIPVNNKPTSLLSLRSKGTCNNSSAFGFSGKCQSSSNLFKSSALPKDVDDIFQQTITPMINKVANAEFCIGDFSGDYVTGSMDQFNCGAFPLDPSYKYGVIASTMNNVPCGDPVTVTICAAFDQCGTVAFSINGGVLSCVAAYTTGIGAALSVVADSLDYINLAISTPKRLMKTFKINYGKGNNVESKSITTRGHFSISAGVSLPADFIKINGYSLEDFLSISVKALLMVDLGKVDSFVTSTIDNLKKISKSTAKAQLNTIIKSGAEITAQIEGSLVIGLDDLSKGLINDLEFTVGKASILITTGTGESGLSTGLYIFLDSDILKNASTVIESLLTQFSGILSQIGFKKPSLSGSTSLGLFIQTDSLGFQFDNPAFKIKCIFIFSSNKASCQFVDKFFTALINDSKWVFKEAKNFFDEAGKTKLSISLAKQYINEAGNALDKGSKAVKNCAKKVLKLKKC